MNVVRTAGLAGVVLAVGGLPVAAFALSASESPAPPAAVQAHPTPPHPTGGDDADSTEPSETEPPETGSPSNPSATPNPASLPGRLHAAAMQAWAHCVAEAASGPKASGEPMPPKLACGEKPVGPGRARHEAASSDGAGQGPGGGHGHSGDHARGRGHAKK